MKHTVYQEHLNAKVAVMGLASDMAASAYLFDLNTK
jgi:hypothetical protein